MDPQFDPNMITWYVIVPLLVLGFAALIWFIVKMQVTAWKRVALSIVSLFAFVGFTTAVLCVYYHTNKPFNAMFKFYAYSKLAPDADPFVPTNGDEESIIKMLVQLEGHKQDGQVYVAQLPESFGFDYGASLFTPGKWQTVKVKDYVMTLQDSDNNGQPDSISTSLWWALRYDPFRLTASAQ